MTRLDFLTSVYFEEQQYLANKAAALNTQNYEGRTDWTADSVETGFASLGISALDHYSQYGAFELNAQGKLGINPGTFFDQNAYYTDKAEQLGKQGIAMSTEEVASAFSEAGTTPLAHYSEYGYAEWVFPTFANIHSTQFTQQFMPPVLSNDYRIDSIAGITNKGVSANVLGAKQGNVLYYAFPTDPKGEISDSDVQELVNVSAFTALQIEGAQEAIKMISKVTGITFEQTNNTEQANLLFFSGKSPAVADGVAFSEWIDGEHNVLVMNTTDFPYMEDLRAGTTQDQFLTVLHEVAHALGLKHPFATDLGPTTLPSTEDNYAYTLMSYTDPVDSLDEEFAWYRETLSDAFLSPYDIAALQWLYGTDGLNGSEGFIYSGA